MIVKLVSRRSVRYPHAAGQPACVLSEAIGDADIVRAVRAGLARGRCHVSGGALGPTRSDRAGTCRGFFSVSGVATGAHSRARVGRV